MCTRFRCVSCNWPCRADRVPCASSPSAAHGMAKRRTDSYSFAPGCRMVYPSVPKASLFAALKDLGLRKKSERKLYRDDKALTISSAVCEHHFEPHLYARLCARGKRQRSADSAGEAVACSGRGTNTVPTLLPGCPTYLSTATPRRRPERKRKVQQKRACQQSWSRSCSGEDDAGAPENEYPDNGSSVQRLVPK